MDSQSVGCSVQTELHVLIQCSGPVVLNRVILWVRAVLLPSRISDLTEQLQAVQETGRLEKQALLDRLQAVTEQKAAAQLETKKLKVGSDQNLLLQSGSGRR